MRARRFFAVAAAAVGLSLAAFDAHAATLSGNVSGTLAVDVYQVTADITVQTGQTFTLQPGTVLKFNAGTSLTVNGTLISSGTAGSPVILTSIKDDAAGGDTNGDGSATSPTVGDWGTVVFSNADPASRVVQTTVRYGTYVYFDASSPVYQDSAVTDMSQAAFKMNGAAGPRGSGVTAANCPINGVDVLSSNVTATRVWSNLGVPYVIRSGQVAVIGGSLTIAAGNVIKALGNVGGGNGVLKSGGAPMTVAGTASNPVIFTSLRDDSVGGDTNNDGSATSPGRGDWQGLIMPNGGGLSYTAIRYAGMPSNQGTPQAALFVQGTPLPMTSVEITSSAAIGLYNNGGGAITGGVFANNASQGYYLESGAISTMTAVEFSGNGGEGLYVGDAQAYVYGATFAYNASYGAHSAGSNGTLWITTATFTNNAAAVIRMQPNSNFLLAGAVTAAGGPLLGQDIASGNVTSVRTWRLSPLPYVIRSGQIAVTGGSLTISAGNVIKGLGNNGGGNGVLKSGGAPLTVAGTAADPVIFTSLHDDSVGGDTNNNGSTTSPGRGDWQGLIMPNGGGLSYTAIRYAGMPSNQGTPQAALFVQGTPLTMTGVEITSSAAIGVYNNGGGALTDGKFYNNASQGYYLESGAISTMTAVEFSGNGGEGLYVGDAQAYVYGATFAYNASYGAHSGGTNGTLWITTATFTNNGAAAIRMQPNSNFQLTGVVTATGGPLLGQDIASGNISAVRTWRRSPLPYVIRSGLVSVNGGSLTIEAGNVIKGLGNNGGNNGVLRALSATLTVAGTASDPVIFTSLKDDTVGGDTNGDGSASSPAKGDWQGVVMQAGGSLSNAAIRYAGMANGLGTPQAGLYTNGPAVALTAVEVSSSAAIGQYNNAGGAATGGKYANNVSQGYYLESGAISTMTAVEFSGNGGEGLYVGDAQAYVYVATFAYNASYGAHSAGTNGTLWITTAAFTNNAAAAIRMQPNSNFQLAGAVTAAGGPLLGQDIASGNVTSVRTWRRSPLPYVIRSGLVSVNGGSLTIEAGNVIKGLGNNGGNNGVLRALSATLTVAGTASDPVIFTSLKDDSIGGDTNGDGSASSPARGDWQGVVMQAGGSLSNAAIRYAGMANGLGTPQAGLYTNGPVVPMNSVEITSSAAMGQYNNAGGTLNGGKFYNNASQGYYLESGAISTMTAVEFSGNGGEGLYVGDAQAYIYDAIFAYNASYGAHSAGSNGTLSITTATFTNNAAAVIRMQPNSNFQLAGAVTAAGGPLLGQDIASGNVTSVRTWRRSPLPYVIRSGLVSVNGGSLTIEAGNVIKGLGNNGGNNGVLRALSATLTVAGTASDPVIFTSLKDDSIGGDTNNDGSASIPAKGDWQGMVMQAGGNLSYAAIRYAGMANGLGTPQAGLYTNGSAVALTAVEVSSSAALGWYTNANATADGLNVFANASQGVNVQSGAVSTMTAAAVAGNGGDGLYVTDAKAYLYNSIFTSNNGYGVNADNASGVLSLSTASFLANVSGAVRLHPQVNLFQSGALTAASSPLNGIDVFSTSAGQSRTWGKGLPYVIRSGDVTFTGGTLTLRPGAVVKLKGVNEGTVGRLRFIGGVLSVQGSAAEPVVFTSLKDDAFGGDTNNDGSASAPAKGDWHGIRLFTGSSVNSIDHVIVRWSGASSGGFADPSFYLSNCTATINNSDLSQAGAAGAYAESASVLSVLNTDVKSNFDGVRENDSTVQLSNCSITGNTNRGVNVTGVGSHGSVQAAFNWWGSATGPTHAGNPGGTGDSVTNNVVYTPYLGSEPSNILPSVVSVTLLDPTPVRPSVSVRLRAFFNKDMDVRTLPTATYGLSSPFTTYAISGGTWTSNSIFEASTTIAGAASDGAYTLKLAGAVDFAGNQISPSQFAYYTVDGTPPGAPTMTSAFTLAGGSVTLVWQAPSGEAAASYRLYRSTEDFASAAGLTAVMVGIGTTTATDVPPADGSYYYASAAVDAAGNEGAISNRIVGVSIRTASSSPENLAAVVDRPGSRVLLSWAAPSTGTAASYSVFRSSWAFPSTVGLTALRAGVTTTLIADALTADATYFYRVEAVDAVGNHSASTGPVAALFDVHPPVVALVGVANGQHSRFDLTPSATITDFSAFTATITLDGLDFTTGTLVTAIGAHTFVVAAQDVFGATSSVSAFFTIDKSSPVIALTFPANGGLYNANVTAAYSLFDDFTATGALIVRNGANQPPPFVFSSEGLNSVLLTATDLAGNVGTATATFTLDKTAPAAVADLRVGDVRVGELDLLWTASTDAISGVAGYLVRVATYPITAGNFLSIPASPAPAVLPAGATEFQTVTADTSKTLYFAVRSTDAAGNLSALSNPVFLDTDPPVLSAISPALGATVSRPTRISLTASDLSGVASVVFTIDGVAVATQTSAPFYYDWATIPLADGEHTVELRAADTVGNAVVVPGFYTLHYAPPAAPTVASPANGFSTFVATVTVTGAIEAGTTAQVRVNGVPAGSAYAPSGSFSASAVLPVEGDYQLTVVATDAKGQSSPSASRTIHYNLAPPNAPVDFTAETRSAGKIHLTWAVPGGKTPVSYRLYRSASAVALSSGVTPGSGLRVASGLTDLAYDDTPPSDGVYYYGTTSLDSSGNESGLSEVASALSDRVAPTAAIAMTTSALAAGQYPLTLTLSKPLASVPILLFVANGAGPAAVSLSASSPTVWVGTLTVTAATPYGAAAFQFQGTDFAGNSGTSITSGGSKFVDNRGPIGAVTLYPFPPLKAGDADLALVLDEPAASTPTLAFVVSGGTYPVALEGAGTTWVATITIPSGVNGTAFFVYAATDALGNRGTTLSSGGSFTTDTTAPGSPLSLSAVSRPAGVVRLSWSGPIGESAAAYRVYRDSVALPGTVAPSGDQTGHYDDSPAEGVYTYETTSIDAAGNESSRSGAAAALSDATPPAAPANSTATISGGQAQISWTAVSGETYRVHRTTYATSSLATAFVLASPTFSDTPPQNGPIYYAIEAVDPAGNLSATASVVSVFFAGAPPVITITGVSDNGLYNSTVFPAFSASDPALDTASVAGRLNGAPFASGSPVSAEGDYTLQATAKNVAAIGSTVTVHFTLDRSSPVISVTGVVAGQGYHDAVVPLVAVTDPRLAAVVLTLNGAAYTAGTPVSADGAYSLVVTARDLAGNVASSTVAFTLDLPPPAPPSFAVAIEEGLGASLSWLSPAGDTAGYRVYRDGAPMHQGLLNQALLSDPSFVLGSGHVYEVAAVDAAGQEGARATATIPAATVELESYGSVENGASYLTRGFFDAVRVRLTNTSASSKLLGPTNITFLSNGVPSTSGAAPSVSVPAGGQLTSEGVLVTPLSLAASASARVTVTLPAGPGASATLRRTFPVAARDPREPIVEVFAGALVRGTNASVQVKVNNQGSAPLQILSAVPSDLLVELRTPEGTVLSSARLSQSGNGAAPSPSGYFVAVPGGSGVLLDPVSVFVPDALGASAQLRARVDRVFSGLVSGGTQGPRAFETIKTMSGVGAPPYRATVRPEFALYDQNNSIRLLGEALDPQDALVPGATVQIGVSLRGFERAASTRTDETGHYQLTFTPTPNEAGGYTLWAGHPSVVDRAPQSSFTVVGLAFQFADYTATLTQNSAVPFRVSLTNTGQTRIDGLSASVISSAVLSGASLTLDPSSLPGSLDAGQSASLSFTASATGAASLGRSLFTARVTESHGFVRNLTVNADVAASQPVPSISPTGFNVGMSAGQSRTLEVRLSNSGTRDWQGVTVTAPTLSWVRVSGSSTLGDIAAGGSKSLFLVLEPPANLPSQAFAANPLVTLQSSNATTIPVNALITLTASGQGNVAYTVINADKPRNQFGAGEGIPTSEVTFVSLDVAGLSFHASADSNGVVRLLNVPAGRYSYTAKAAGFEDVTGVETIEPGVTLTKELLLPTNVVTYTWTVEPTTIQDKYDIQLGITFKTDVPAPVVSIDPAVMNFNLGDGESADAQMTVENKGLINATDVDITPEISDPAVIIDMPFHVIPVLHAGEKIVVPFRVGLVHASCHSAKVSAGYSYTCAAGTTLRKKAPAINMSLGSCFNLPTTTVGGGGGSGGFTSAPAGGSGGSGISLSVPASYVSFAIPNPPSPPAPPNSCRPPSVKYPSECTTCDQLGAYSDPGGDPRVPESDLSIAVPKFGGSLDFTRVYDSQDYDSGPLGRGWTHSFNSHVMLTRAAVVFFKDRAQGDTFSSADYANSEGGTSAMVMSNGTASEMHMNPDWLAEMRTPSGRRLLFRHTGGTGFSAPPGEPSTLTLEGSTSTPTGFVWTLPDKTIYHYDAAGKLLTMTDRNGNVVTLTYSGGQLTTVKDPDNRTLYTLTYSGGALSQVQDIAARTVSFSYSSGRLSQAVGPKGTSSYGYTSYDVPNLEVGGFGDGLFVQSKTVTLLTSITAPNGHVTSFTYGPPGKAVDYKLMPLFLASGGGGSGQSFTTGNAGFGSAAVSEGHSTPATSKGYYTPVVASGGGFVVDVEGFARWFLPQRLYTLSESGPLGTYTFEHTVDELIEGGSTVVTDPRGFKETRYWENKKGRAQTGVIQDAGGGETKTTYDSNRYPAQLVDRAGQTTNVIYDSKGNLLRVTNALGHSYVYTYDPVFNRKASITDARSNQTHFSYDQNGNLTRTENARGAAYTINYGPTGLPIEIADPNQKKISIGRDAQGQITSVTDPFGAATQIQRDTLGRIEALTDRRGKTVHRAYDNDDNLTETRDAVNAVTLYEYQPAPLGTNKLLTRITDPNNHAFQFGYDTRGRITSVTNPLSASRSYQYNNTDQLTQVTRADGSAVSVEYDTLGRLIKKSLPGDQILYSYNSAGSIVSAEDADSKITIDYDALERPTKVIQTNKPAALTTQLSFEYDANGNRTKMTLGTSQSAMNWSYSYDNLDRLTTIIDPQNRTFSFEYDNLDRRTRLVYPNNLEAIFAYNDASQPTLIVHRRQNDQIVLSSTAYTYDAGGNVSTLIDAAGLHTFTYDDASRLVSVMRPAGSALSNESFSYDLAGNRASANGQGAYSHDVANRLQSTSLETFDYDQNGNRTLRTVLPSSDTHYTWDKLDHLTGVTPSSGTAHAFRYDAFGRLIEDATASTIRRFIYAGSEIVAVADSGNNLETIITYGPNEAEPLQIQSPTTALYLHSDRLGSIRAVTNSQAQAIETVEYSAYGHPTFHFSGSTFVASQSGNMFAFTGAEWYPDFGLSRHGERFLDVNVGSFISEETYGYDGTNKYWYAYNNPTNYVDRNGAFAQAIVAVCIAQPELCAAPIIIAAAWWLLNPPPPIPPSSLPHLSSPEKEQPKDVTPPANPPAPDCAQPPENQDPNDPGRKKRSSLDKNFSKKIRRQMKDPRRNWTEKEIEEAYEQGKRHNAINKANQNPATRYEHPTNGKSIVVDDITGEVIQVAREGFLW